MPPPPPTHPHTWSASITPLPSVKSKEDQPWKAAVPAQEGGSRGSVCPELTALPPCGATANTFCPRLVTSPRPHFKSGLYSPPNLFWGVLPEAPPLLTPPQTKHCVRGWGVGVCVFPQHRAHLDGPAPQTGGKVRMP